MPHYENRRVEPPWLGWATLMLSVVAAFGTVGGLYLQLPNTVWLGAAAATGWALAFSLFLQKRRDDRTIEELIGIVGEMRADLVDQRGAASEHRAIALHTSRLADRLSTMASQARPIARQRAPSDPSAEDAGDEDA